MSENTLTLTLYGEIGLSWWGDGTTASDVAAQLEKHPAVETIHVHINSPGGHAFEAMAILAQLQRHPARIVVNVDGVAASAASVIAMAGDEIRINEGGFIMIHEAACLAQGCARDHQRAADLLAKLDGAMADIYARRSGTSRDELLAAMSAETWYSAHEAVEAGLADSVVKGEEVIACAGLSRFHNVPAGLAVTAKVSARRPPPPIPDQLLQLFAPITRTQETRDMELAVLLSALGLPAETDESAALKHITVLRSEHGESSRKADKLATDLAERDDQVAALTGEVARLKAEKATAALESKLSALLADARITETQADIVRDMFAAGQVEAATKLADSFDEAPARAPTGPRQSLAADDAGTNRKAPSASAGDLDWQALASELPEHVRALGGQSLANNPRAFITANQHTPWAQALGIDWDSVSPERA